MKYSCIAFFSLFFVIILLFSSCLEKGEKAKAIDEWKTYSESFMKKHLNKKALYLDVIENSTMKFFCNENPKKNLVKILVNVDIDCSSCLLKFSFWNHFSSALQKKYGLQIPIIVYINADNDNVKKRVEYYWKGSWVYDKEGLFIQKNELYDDRFQAVLIDKDDNIRLIGNPMHNENLAELYEKTIVDLLENEAQQHK